MYLSGGVVAFSSSFLTQQKFLLEEKFLQQQLLDDFLLVSWVEVVDGVSEDGLINWNGGDIGDGQDEEQCLQMRERNICTLIFDGVFDL